MKIRSGFVSNSSSSSFILLGCKTEILRIKPKDLAENTYFVMLDVSTNEGTCIFEIVDDEMLAVLQHELIGGLIDTTYISFAEGEESIPYQELQKAKVPKKYQKIVGIETFNKDYHTPGSAAELLGQLKYSLDEAEYQELLKAFPKITPVVY